MPARTGYRYRWLLVGSLFFAGLVAGCVGAGTGGHGATQADGGPAGDDGGSPDTSEAADDSAVALSGNSPPGPGGDETVGDNDDGGQSDNTNQSGATGSDGAAYDDPPTDDLLDGTDSAEYLDTLAVAHVRVGERTFLVWVVDEPETRQQGLMFVTEEELADLPDGRLRGMLFAYGHDTRDGFWMRNTIAALDIAFVEAGGSIVTIHSMTPLDETIYWPDGPYRYALEVNAGTFAELGVEPGDFIELP